MDAASKAHLSPPLRQLMRHHGIAIPLSIHLQYKEHWLRTRDEEKITDVHQRDRDVIFQGKATVYCSILFWGATRTKSGTSGTNSGLIGFKFMPAFFFKNCAQLGIIFLLVCLFSSISFSKADSKRHFNDITLLITYFCFQLWVIPTEKVSLCLEQNKTTQWWSLYIDAWGRRVPILCVE